MKDRKMLAVKAVHFGGPCYRVYFDYENVVGVIPITFEETVPDRVATAEAFVIHFLIVKCKVGGESLKGDELRLNVSDGTIKKCLRGHSQKHHLARWTAWMSPRLYDAEIIVGEQAFDQDHIELCYQRDLREGVVSPYFRPYLHGQMALADTILYPPLGRISVCFHAAERYRQRVGAETVSDAWLYLKEEISKGNVSVEEGLTKGEDRDLDVERRVYGRSLCGFVLVFCVKNHLAHLVTVYRAEPTEALMAA